MHNKAESTRSEITKLLGEPTLQEVVATVLALNVADGKVPFSMPLIMVFFKEIKEGDLSWCSVNIKNVLNSFRVVMDITLFWSEKLEGAVRLLGLAGLVSWTLDPGDDFYYMDARQVDIALGWYRKYKPGDRESLDELARRYKGFMQEHRPDLYR